MSQDSPVSTVAGCGLDNRDSSHGKGRDFSLHYQALDVRVNNVISTPPYILMVYCLIKQMDNFLLIVHLPYLF
jgi:hypothetical protein